jgi:serine/threonine protein kinase
LFGHHDDNSYHL